MSFTTTEPAFRFRQGTRPLLISMPHVGTHVPGALLARFTEEARRLRPDITFGADIIAGFPTETEAAFANSLALVADCHLTWLHVFPYSPRPGTPASRMPQVRGPAIKDRAARLRAAGDAAVQAHLTAQIGQTHHILMESPRMGRTAQFAEVHFDTDQPESHIVTATIKAAEGALLRA